MRTYIIANDGITLSRRTPAAMTEGEIAVTSKEELHAAPLSGKRLLALGNARGDRLPLRASTAVQTDQQDSNLRSAA